VIETFSAKFTILHNIDPTTPGTSHESLAKILVMRSGKLHTVMIRSDIATLAINRLLTVLILPLIFRLIARIKNVLPIKLVKRMMPYAVVLNALDATESPWFVSFQVSFISWESSLQPLQVTVFMSALYDYLLNTIHKTSILANRFTAAAVLN
jgi:hypothetical protein